MALFRSTPARRRRRSSSSRYKGPFDGRLYRSKSSGWVIKVSADVAEKLGGRQDVRVRVAKRS